MKLSNGHKHACQMAVQPAHKSYYQKGFLMKFSRILVLTILGMLFIYPVFAQDVTDSVILTETQIIWQTVAYEIGRAHV